MRIVLVFSLLAVSVPVYAQGIDPATMLGKPQAQVLADYPRDCKKLAPATPSSLIFESGVMSCKLHHHPKYLFGVKIGSQVLFFKDGKLIPADFGVKGAGMVQALGQRFGLCDSPSNSNSADYRYGSSTYDDGNSSMTLDTQGESHIDALYWTKGSFQVRWSSSSYESWDQVANNLPGFFRESVSFSIYRRP
jgi:hypothetical protein